MTHVKSKALTEKARALIPGGVNSPVRSFKSVGGDPIVVQSAQGSTICDVDGNTLDDYVLSWGPMLFGHRDPATIAAIESALTRGTSFGMNHADEVRFAELFLQAVPEMDMVRAVNSGTEATMSTIRLARGVTGRDLLVKFVGCYHGHGDSLLVQAGSGVATLGIPGSPGIPAAIAAQTLTVNYNDSDALTALIRERGEEIAAVIVETLPCNMGYVEPEEAFLATLRTLEDSGILLIADEVLTGFRVPTGAAFRRYGLQPDLTTWGKVIGAGLPFAAYAGKRKLMEQLAPVGPVYQAGTLSGNPLATAAAVAVLEQWLALDLAATFDAPMTRLLEGLRGAANRYGIPFDAAGQGSLFGFFFRDGRPRNFADVEASDHKRYARWFSCAREAGIFVAPSGYEVGFLSTVHSDAQIDRFVETFSSFVGAL